MRRDAVEDPFEPFSLSLRIGREARPHLRQGLTPETAHRIADIVLRIAPVDACAITDDKTILAVVGQGCANMGPGHPVQTDATRRVLRTGRVESIASKEELQCSVPGCPCPIRTAVIAPLHIQGEVVGTVKLYNTSPSPVPDYVQRLAEGLSELLSLEMEVAEAERQRELLAQARLEALQAQIRPHFLFNVLTTMREELETTDLYLRLESARFGSRLTVEQEVDPSALDVRIPVLTLQPLVENAVVHGLAPKDGDGRLRVVVRRVGAVVRMLVADDGVGMSREKLTAVLSFGVGEGMGLGLNNVRERLVGLLGHGARLRVMSWEGRGTLVYVRLPVLEEEGRRAPRPHRR
jgi:LytS/YehU family sensor histidine kinase